MRNVKFIDLFCGIGGFHYAIKNAAKSLKLKAECVFSSDIDADARLAYEKNFSLKPAGDITQIEASSVPDHNILLAGFPCQAFSIIGDRKGFEDTRGTLFFDIARILKAKRPEGFVLENVKQLRGHDGGNTLRTILNTLNELGYDVQFNILNALDFGLPQKRERIFIVGWRKQLSFDWDFHKVSMRSLSSLLETDVDKFYFASERIRQQRLQRIKNKLYDLSKPTIWHENKSGNIGIYEFSCAMRAGASYNYLLVNGERRLTEREMLRLQGFPDTFQIVHNYGTVRRFAGNSLPIPVASGVISKLLRCNWINDYGTTEPATKRRSKDKSSVSAQ
jgi:DNA (cytosine-5)-methyltransferase 1